MIRVRLSVALRRHAGGRERLELSCRSVAECLAEMENLYPDLHRAICCQDGLLLPSVHLYLNGEEIRNRSSLASRLEDGDELTLLMPIAGG